MILKSGNHSITINQEEYHSSGSNDHLKHYSKQYHLAPKYQPSAVYGLVVDDQFKCLILAAGGGTNVSEQSVVFQPASLYVGLGDQLVCLSLPDLQLLWHKQVDEATCFGIYLSPDGMGLLAHGEMAVSKVSFAGETIWSYSGKDILTGGFVMHEKHAEVIDFNKQPYHIDIKSGEAVLV
jgi:hypothetical protein